MSIAARERLFAVSIVTGMPATFGARSSLFRMETLLLPLLGLCYGGAYHACVLQVCQDEGRDSFEEMMKAGIITAKQLDKDMD